MGANIILAMGALVIFGTFLSSSNRLMTANTQIAEQNEYYISAISLAQGVIDEAKSKAFDQNTDTSIVTLTGSLTAPGSLGKDGAAESVPNPDTLYSGAPFSASSPGYRSTAKFNDIDDYNDYKRRVNTPRAEGFTVSVKVNYANETTPDLSLAVRSFCKRMVVTVSSPFLTSPVKLSYAFTY